MAPKGMKRPAAAVLKRPAAKAPLLMKRPAGKAKDEVEIAQKCEAIKTEIMGFEDLPLSVRRILCASIKETLPTMKEDRHKVQHELVEMMAEAMRDIEAKYKQDVEECQETVNNADANRAARLQAEKESDDELLKLKTATAAAKEAVAEDNKSLTEAKAALNSSKVDQARGDKEIMQIEANKDKLDSTMQDVFLPMNEKAATGREGSKALKVLEKVGKEFKFDPSMLESVLPVLAQEPAARGSFDIMVVKQLEDSFAATRANLVAKLMELAPGKKERADLVSEKEGVLSICEEKAKASKAALESAVAAEALGMKTFTENRRKTMSFFPDLKKASDSLDYATYAFQAFKTTMQGFLDLKELAPPPPEPEPVEVEEPAAVEEPVAVAVTQEPEIFPAAFSPSMEA